MARDPFYISRSPHGVSFSHNFFAECFLQNNISGAVFTPRSSCSLLLAIVTSSRAKGGIEGGVDGERVKEEGRGEGRRRFFPFTTFCLEPRWILKSLSHKN